jgi:hypothetical protein
VNIYNDYSLSSGSHNILFRLSPINGNSQAREVVDQVVGEGLMTDFFLYFDGSSPSG